MSARSFWGLLVICMIIVVEWLIAKPIVEWRVSSEIINSNIPYNQVFISEPADSDRVVTDVDLTALTFGKKIEILFRANPWLTFSLVGAVSVLGLLVGFLLASVAFRHMVNFGDKLGVLSTIDKILIVIGLLIGLALTAGILPTIIQLLMNKRDPVVFLVGGVVITYLCVIAIVSMKQEISSYFPSLAKGPIQEQALQKPKILDTNVIIDGRVADVCSTGFLEGQICIPSFILEELQHIADSGDSLKRARGRRGLEILHLMQKELDLCVKQYDPVDPANPDEIDARLIKLAKEMDGCIVTNDFNLNQVAELQGVTVLNLNELANALKPIVLPGEDMKVTIIKEGKEPNQGIAYLDDGTMVVVEAARKNINDTVEVVVTSVLQTVAGKMIFANLKSVQQAEDELIDRNIRNYSSFRPRKKTR